VTYDQTLESESCLVEITVPGFCFLLPTLSFWSVKEERVRKESVIGAGEGRMKEKNYQLLTLEHLGEPELSSLVQLHEFKFIP
jgi:hypothetical protein